MRVIIAGNGRPLHHLCRSFAEKGHSVTVVDPDREECERIARRLAVEVLHADGTDAGALEEAGVAGADAVIALSPRDEENMLICQTASTRYSVERTIALVSDPENVGVFERFGIGAVSTAGVIADLLERRASFSSIVNLLPLAEGKVGVTEILLRDGAPVIGRTLRELAMPADSLVAVVVRNGSPIVPRGDHRFASGDRIAIVTLPEAHDIAVQLLTGEKGGGADHA